jgi:hypothetical protein
MEALIAVLDIDSRSRRIARLIWPMVERRASEIVEAFYAGTGGFAAAPSRAMDGLKASQREHWKCLFESRFDDGYVRSASLLGVVDKYLALDMAISLSSYACVLLD